LIDSLILHHGDDFTPNRKKRNSAGGFSFFGSYGKIFNVRIEKSMNALDGEAVARRVNRNREWTQMAANLWERDRLGRRGARLATRPGKQDRDRDVFGETPNTAVETTALPADRISGYWRRLACIGGSALNSRKSLISMKVLNISCDVLQMGAGRWAGSDFRFCSPEDKGIIGRGMSGRGIWTRKTKHEWRLHKEASFGFIPLPNIPLPNLPCNFTF
jgi:hypothetical protein